MLDVVVSVELGVGEWAGDGGSTLVLGAGVATDELTVVMAGAEVPVGGVVGGGSAPGEVHATAPVSMAPASRVLMISRERIAGSPSFCMTLGWRRRRERLRQPGDCLASEARANDRRPLA